MAVAVEEEIELRLQWECRDCGMTVRHVTGQPLSKPKHWDRDLCVVCCRQEAQREGGKNGALAFELTRGIPVQTAAKATRSPMKTAQSMYRKLIRQGVIEPQPRTDGGTKRRTPREAE